MRHRKKNPLPKMLQNPLLWILGGGAIVWAGYALYSSRPAPAALTAPQSAQVIAVWQAALVGLVNSGQGGSQEAISLRASITAAGGTPVA